MLTPLEVRQRQYQNVVNEVTFISRASEGTIPEDFILNQPIFIRKKYREDLEKELEERKRNMENRQARTRHK